MKYAKFDGISVSVESRVPNPAIEFSTVSFSPTMPLEAIFVSENISDILLDNMTLTEATMLGSNLLILRLTQTQVRGKLIDAEKGNKIISGIVFAINSIKSAVNARITTDAEQKNNE